MIDETKVLTRPAGSRIDLGLISSESIAILLTISAVALWFGSLNSIDLRQMTDLGLVSILPPACFVALLLVVISFCIMLHGNISGRREILLYLNVIVLVVLLYGITLFIEDAPRFAVTWIHAGFTEYIMRTGTLATKIDARFSWPGFFTANALLTQVAGLSNPIEYAGWASLVFNLIYLFPLLMIVRAFTIDKRLQWASIWFFYLANWIGQDYFSPQGLNFFLYLVILGVVLRWFKGDEASIADRLDRLKLTNRLDGAMRWLRQMLNSRDTPDAASSVFERVGLLLVIVCVFAAIASSHQLTPAALIIALGALVIFNRCELRTLPILFGVIAVAWISYMTVDYLAGHARGLIGEIGNIFASMSHNVTGRIKGSAEHQVVLTFRLAMTMAIWVLAFLGSLRRMILGHLDLTCVLLLCAPFPLVALNSYGGEALLRVYLFALPFAVFLAAALVYPTSATQTTIFRTIVLGVLSLTLLTGYLFARYGNERADYMTFGEVEAFQYLYDHAPSGSQVILASNNGPDRYRDVEKYDFTPDPDLFPLRDAAGFIGAMKADPDRQSFLILTRSQEAFGEMFEGKAPGWKDELLASLLATGQVKVIFQNSDAVILVLVENAT